MDDSRVSCHISTARFFTPRILDSHECGNSPLAVEHNLVWKPDGFEIHAVFDANHQLGCQGCPTVHQGSGEVMPAEEAVRRSHEHPGPLMMQRTA